MEPLSLPVSDPGADGGVVSAIVAPHPALGALELPAASRAITR